MYYCNELNGLSVLSLFEGELLGIVDKLYFDKKIKKLLELELVGTDGIRLILPVKNIYFVGKNAITVKNNQAVKMQVEETSLTICPINSKAFSINGEFLGIIKEVSLNEKFLTEKISLDNNQTLEITDLASSGKNTVIFNSKTEKINLKKFTPKKSPKLFKSNKVQTAQILPEPVEQNNTMAEEIIPTPITQEAQKTPAVNIQNLDFLLGRVCTKDIFNFNNELLIRAHTLVNKKNIKEINKYGKLRELMLYSKEK